MRLFNEEKGTALILMALGMAVIMALTALVTDVGLMYYNKSKVANAADAAALAGVQALPSDEMKARELAREYAVKNGVNNITVNIGEDKKHIEVLAERTIGLMLAKAIHIDTSTARARSQAALEPLTGVRGIVPLGVTEQEFIFGETYLLKYAAGDDPEGDYHSGWLGLLALQGPGARLYLEDLKYGFEQEVKIGDILDIQTGNISGNTYDGVQYRIDECKHLPSCTYDSYHEDCARLMFIPIIKPSGDNSIEVVSFAVFFVESVEGMGVDNYITGKFIRHTVSGSSSVTGPDNGVYVPRLSR